MKNSQEFTHVQNDIAHLYSMHLATIRTGYKMISLPHHTNLPPPPDFSFSCMLVVSCTAVIDGVFVCTLYFVFLFYFCLFSCCIV